MVPQIAARTHVWESDNQADCSVSNSCVSQELGASNSLRVRLFFGIMPRIVLLALFLAALFQQVGLAEHPLHTSSLSCLHSGEPVPCMAGDPMRCDRADDFSPLPSRCGATVDHLEVRDETGRVQFQQSAPPGDLFASANLGRDGGHVMELRTSTRGAPDQEVLIALDIADLGLVPFSPPLTCRKGFLGTTAYATGSGDCIRMPTP